MKKNNYRENRIKELKGSLIMGQRQLAELQAQTQQVSSLILQTQGGILELQKEEAEIKKQKK